MDRGGSTARNRGIEHCLVSEMDHDFVDGSSANLFSEETQNPILNFPKETRPWFSNVKMLLISLPNIK